MRGMQNQGGIPATDTSARSHSVPNSDGVEFFGSFCGGLAAATWTSPIAFIPIVAIQRIFAGERDMDYSPDAPATDIQ